MRSRHEPFNLQESFTGDDCLQRRTSWIVLLLLVCILPGMGQQGQDVRLQSLLAAAREAQGNSHFAEAAEDFRLAIHLRPQSAELWANLGLMQYEAGQNMEALHSFEHSLQLQPSLYVPELFIGVDYVRMEQGQNAIPYLLKAEAMNSKDPLPPLTLGQAYSQAGRPDEAAKAYDRAIALDPKESRAWFGLGIARLDQVEADSRRMTEEFRTSAYARTLFAQSLAQQARNGEAILQYRAVLNMHPRPPCVRAELGFLLLRQDDFSGAGSEFKREQQEEPGCSLASLGESALFINQGQNDQAVKLLESLWGKDRGFLQSNASTLTTSITSSHGRSFKMFLVEEKRSGAISSSLYQMLSGVFIGQPELPSGLRPTGKSGSLAEAQQAYAAGRYAECSEYLVHGLADRNTAEVQLLTRCAWFTGAYHLTARSASRLAFLDPHSAGALYWSIKANERLAYEALEKYEQMEPNSERSHLLLGDIYRQRDQFLKAETEYRWALSIKPHSAAALYGLASAYFGDGNIPKTIQTARLALEQMPDDPELNLLAGEAYVANRQYPAAAPCLKIALGAKPQMIPHVHALLGEVYEHTEDTQQAIAQLKLGLSSDQDGSLHYQLARLYRKIGDTKDAAAALAETRAIQERLH